MAFTTSRAAPPPLRDRSRGTPRRSAASQILVLQRRAGNRAVRRLLRKETGFGLRSKTVMLGFTGEMADYWRANPTKTLKEYVEHVMTALNDRLAAHGVPRVGLPGTKPLQSAGGFARASWQVFLAPADTAKKPLDTKIGDVPADRMAEVTGICIHEVRHAEQSFLVARMVAAEGAVKDAKTLATSLDIPVAVAQAAIASKDAMPDKAGMAKVRAWRAFQPGGKHRDYWEWNEDFRRYASNAARGLPTPSPQGVDRIIETTEKLFPTITSWRTVSLPFVDKKLAALAKQKRMDAADTIASRDMKRIRDAGRKLGKAQDDLARMIAAHKARKADPKRPMTRDYATKTQQAMAMKYLELEIAMITLWDITGKAYEAYPHEADSYALQAEAQKLFLATPAKAAPAGKP